MDAGKVLGGRRNYPMALQLHRLWEQGIEKRYPRKSIGAPDTQGEYRRLPMPDGFPEAGIWQSRPSLVVLDVARASLDNGAPIHRRDWYGGNNQL
jgi:hypothetical protein